MKIGDEDYQSIWLDRSDPTAVCVIDQKRLPFFFDIARLRSVEDVFNAIEDMTVRGAPLIGAAGAYGMYLATLEITSQTDIYDHLSNAARYLISSRPTAINLSRSVNIVLERLKHSDSLPATARKAAEDICENEKENCRHIGIHGLKLIRAISKKKKGEPVNILTHCNAGWLACIDYGTATAPLYLAHEKGIPLHVWVDETRPLNQGSRLTAWELQESGVPYSVIPDNSGGYLMQKGMVDIVIVGCDRTTGCGDVANKTGTYLKALAAHDNNIPFYVACPSTSIDLTISNGLEEIPIEERDPEEVTTVTGLAEGRIETIRICPGGAGAVNYGFDITPSRLITGLITERGICKASGEGITKILSDKNPNNGRGS
jgi:methylthioribose-1-phosphate isomerase